MFRFAVLVSACLASASWAAAETIDVKYYGKLDLAPFACADISRSSFINRACYDKTQQFMVVQPRSIYYPHCEMRAATFEAFLTAPSMGNTIMPTSKALAQTVLLIVGRIAFQNIRCSLEVQRPTLSIPTHTRMLLVKNAWQQESPSRTSRGPSCQGINQRFNRASLVLDVPHKCCNLL
ncbi:hypothetical protein ACVW1A_004527 [Bradyrhizobium sp. LB1.3]